MIRFLLIPTHHQSELPHYSDILSKWYRNSNPSLLHWISKASSSSGGEIVQGPIQSLPICDEPPTHPNAFLERIEKPVRKNGPPLTWPLPVTLMRVYRQTDNNNQLTLLWNMINSLGHGRLIFSMADQPMQKKKLR